ncbi:hypothetical protein A4G19_03880 [Pasteurellaceae bacterium Macca]|nr:hypothetical protein [Pasteurellaceae bacterium Macca]
MSFLKSQKSLPLTLGLSLSIALTGCQSVGGGSSASNDDNVEFFTKSGIQACLVGAGLGAGVCLLSNSGKSGLCCDCCDCCVRRCNGDRSLS